MAGDFTTHQAHYGSDETFSPSRSRSGSLGGSAGCGPLSPHYEVIDGLLYRKKLERGFINYREVLAEDRRLEAIATFHRRRPGTRHLSLEETYKAVAENYWWEGMFFQIRDHVLGCAECLGERSQKPQDSGGTSRLSTTVASLSRDILSKLQSQREAGLFCDITLRTDGSSYCAHRAVLAAMSEYFQEIFTEMDASTKADVDLTGFSEQGLLSLLDFSYSSTLCVRREDLHEVSAMARHLGMWHAVEACSTLQREQEKPQAPCPRTALPHRAFQQGGRDATQDFSCHPRKRRRVVAEERLNSSFGLTLDTSDESVQSPRRVLRRTPVVPRAPNGLPVSPSHRMKLMDFKSPSCKKSSLSSRSAVSALKSCAGHSSPPPHTRLLRSTPGAAQEVLKLLPRPESPRRNKRSYPVTRPSPKSRSESGVLGPPVLVKQEEDEEDCTRAQEKNLLMNVLGLQRTALLPRPEDLIGWRQKKRLRKLKANNYSLTKRRKPRPQPPQLAFGDLSLSLPLCNPINTRLLNSIIKTEPQEPISVDQKREKRQRCPRRVPPSDRSMRSKDGSLYPLQPPARPPFGGRELRQSVRRGDGSPLPSRPPPHRGNRALMRSLARIKSEPVGYAISAPPDSRRGATQTCRPAPSTRAQDRNRKIVRETVRTLRYNSSRPANKARSRCVTSRRDGRLQRDPRRLASEVETQGLQGSLRDGLGCLGDRSNGLPTPDPVPPSLYDHPLYRVIKEEPVDPLPVSAPFPDPPSLDLGKRQSKPPIKLLDPGFLFSFCRPAGGPMMSVKREEESVDICLTRSVSRGEGFGGEETQARVLRARGGQPTIPPVKREPEEQSVSQSRIPRPRTHCHRSNRPHRARPAGANATGDMPKGRSQLLPLSGKKCVLLDSIRQARLKRLRGPRRQTPQGPRSLHMCMQCNTTYRDCEALLVHRLRHVEGKQWPCPLCSKTFFRLRNVRNHIHTHDQKLYKCRRCLLAAS